MTLQQMKSVDIRTVDPNTLADADKVTVSMDLPKPERMADIARQLGNPYCFRCGKIAVKLNYADTAVTIDERVENFMRRC